MSVDNQGCATCEYCEEQIMTSCVKPLQKERIGAMSDHEINLAVAKKWFDLEDVTEVIETVQTNKTRFKKRYPSESVNENIPFVTSKVIKTIKIDNEDGYFNPCNKWDDVMPIAQENKIEILATWDGAVYQIARKTPSFRAEPRSLGRGGCQYPELIAKTIQSNNKNMKRAICEVFLMMEVKEL